MSIHIHERVAVNFLWTVSCVYRREFSLYYTMVRKSKATKISGVSSLSKLGKPLLTNRYILYALAVLSVVNLVGYLMVGDYGSMVFFILAGILATYFTKNMIITLLTAILLTNVVYRWMKSNGMVRRLEGFENGEKGEKGEKKTKKAKEPRPATEKEEDDDDDVDAERVDSKKTAQEAYKQIETLLGKEGIDGLTKEAKSVAQEQMKLMETMKSMEPFMENMFKTVDKFGGIESLVGMASKLGGSSLKK